MFMQLVLRKLLVMFPQKDSEIVNKDIAFALERGNPYHHQWFIQKNHTKRCYKCGEISKSNQEDMTTCSFNTFREATQ